MSLKLRGVQAVSRKPTRLLLIRPPVRVLVKNGVKLVPATTPRKPLDPSRAARTEIHDE
jgi:hypothetical protein